MPKIGTLIKAHIVDAVAERNGYTRKKSIEIDEILLKIIKLSLESGEDVMISDFGKLCVKKMRQGRNPAKGENLMLKPRKVATFKCSGKLRERFNDN